MIDKIVSQSWWYFKYYLSIIWGKLSHILPDKLFLKIHYRHSIGKKLNIDAPVTYNEKINWLKLYDRNPRYIQLADKYSVREFIKDTIGERYLIPLLGVWDSVDDIDFARLPNQFVLKCTHDSGSVVICKDKSLLDVSGAKKKLKKCLKTNYYWYNREWVYKNVPRRIIAERYVIDDEDGELRDYKVFCFHGEPKMLYVATSRSIGQLTFDYYDMDFNRLDVRQYYPNAKIEIHKPKNFELMKELASRLSVGIPNVRVDFYEANGNLYFSEMTFYNNGGTTPYDPEEWDYKFGELLDLPIRSK